MKCASAMGLGEPKKMKMIRNCYQRRKAHGRALYELIEKKWKWPKKKNSKWRGVAWSAGKKKWQVSYSCAEGRCHIGYYDNERAAAEAYDNAVRAAGLTKMKLNFPKRRPKRASGKKPASKGAAKKKKSSSKRRR